MPRQIFGQHRLEFADRVLTVAFIWSACKKTLLKPPLIIELGFLSCTENFGKYKLAYSYQFFTQSYCSTLLLLALLTKTYYFY